ncbi:MAG TPA: hypothetical protein VIQ74_10325 [Gemmatimonadaceae bacterium]
MPLLYANLDPITRRYCLAEFDHDVARGTVAISSRIRPGAIDDYVELLRQALAYYDDQWLEDRIEGMLVDFELRNTPTGSVTTAKLPSYAARVIAEGDFNRYYMRGVCARALAEGLEVVEGYRARLSAEPRPESVELEGQQLRASDLLDELRIAHPDPTVEAALGKPNSGLSVRLV